MSNWIKIERNSSGFATEKCLDKLIEFHNQGYPIVVVEHTQKNYQYHIIFPTDNILSWISEIERDTDFTEFIEIPPFD